MQVGMVANRQREERGVLYVCVCVCVDVFHLCEVLKVARSLNQSDYVVCESITVGAIQRYQLANDKGRKKSSLCLSKFHPFLFTFDLDRSHSNPSSPKPLPRKNNPAPFHVEVCFFFIFIVS